MMPDHPVNLHPSAVDVVHLICPCQLGADPPRSLCGLDVTDVVLIADLAGLEPCVVCLDLGATAVLTRRCDRCPS